MKIGAAWLGKTQDGKSYMSCQITIPLLGKLSFALFKNEQKEKDNQPDYNIVWSEPRKESGGSSHGHEIDDTPF
ncbi:MAG: DUF736 family protein [Wenzhouxiangella sp.]|nr:DUF736 family protein [Wenzhouxiangella sp.]